QRCSMPGKSLSLSRYLLFVIASLVIAANASAQVSQNYEKTNYMIPMRDGVKLSTDVYAPKNVSAPPPFIFSRTPYGIDGSGENLNSYLKDLAEDGYIFVFQDIRGRYKSEGQFVMQRPPRDPKDARAIDESTDTYDTIDWLIKNIPKN